MSGSNNLNSCIRIRGIHLLPPIINDKKRDELKNYKERAIKCEQRLQNSKNLQKSLQELFKYKSVSKSEQSLSSRSELGLCENLRSKRCGNLSTNIVDVTEFNDDGINVIHSPNSTPYENKDQMCLDKSREEFEYIEKRYPSSTKSKDSCLSTSSEAKWLHNITSTKTNVADLTDDLSCEKPRLLRSNSYTLESPCPSLLAYLEKCTNKSENDSQETNTSDNEFSSIKTVYNQTFSDTEFDSPLEIKNAKSYLPQIEVIHTDLSVQHITVNAHPNDQNILDKSSLLEILKSVPETQTKEIVELIEKSMVNQSEEKDVSYNQKEEFARNDSVANENRINNNFNKDIVQTDNTRDNSYLNIGQIPICTNKPSTLVSDDSTLQFLDRDDVSYVDRDYFKSALNYCIPENCWRRLFVTQLDVNAANVIKREWAASIIGAHVRGYLTRRLLKTEKIQGLIDTIKDTLICALQLHSAKNIDESDVELHRRLINQVTSACHAFHDVFSLPVAEQMSIIASDRQLKIEKTKRLK